jgi:hypothetical protein
MATRVHESDIIPAAISEVWAAIRIFDFDFLDTVKKVEFETNEKNPSQVGNVRVIHYMDKTIQKVRLTELSDARQFLSYTVFESDPPIAVMSVVHTVRLRRVTANNTTFAEWITDFSADASQAVIQDQRFKQKERLEALKKYFEDDDDFEKEEHKASYKALVNMVHPTTEKNSQATGDKKSNRRDSSVLKFETRSDVDWDAELVKYQGEGGK